MLHDISFNAEVRDIFDAQGNPIPAEIGRGVYRDDTEELISICGSIFKPIQHREIVDPILMNLEGMGYKTEEVEEVNENNLHALQGKKGAFVQTELTKGGAIMRTNITLGDFIEPTGNTRYLKQGPDTNFFRLSILNSHNNSYAARVNTDYLRVLCMNGQTSPNFQAGAYGKHTLHFDITGMQTQIENAMKMMGEDADKFGLWANTKLSVEDATRLLQMTIAKLAPKPHMPNRHSEKLVLQLMDKFAKEDQTVWGLYNAITSWSTHNETRKTADKVTSLLSRENRVAKAIRSDEWNDTIQQLAA